jgi:hypothetical protein
MIDKQTQKPRTPLPNGDDDVPDRPNNKRWQVTDEVLERARAVLTEAKARKRRLRQSER